MIYIAICDDEKYYREQMEYLIKKHLDDCQIQYNIDVFSSGKELYEKEIGILKYNIFFLDINLNEKSGIEIAYKIRENKKDAFIVFVTGIPNYALEGYKVDAFRYIMKDTLKVSIAECINAIIIKMEIQLNKMELLFIEGKKEVYTDKIFYIESQRHKLKFYILESRIAEYNIYDKLDNSERKLKRYGFLRIHKSYLVNVKYIEKISNYKAILTFGIELSIPKSRYQSVKEAFALYKGEL